MIRKIVTVVLDLDEELSDKQIADSVFHALCVSIRGDIRPVVVANVERGTLDPDEET